MKRHRSLQVLDRIGAGDAYAAGVLLGYAEKWSLQRTADFAITNAVLAHTMLEMSLNHQRTSWTSLTGTRERLDSLEKHCVLLLMDDCAKVDQSAACAQSFTAFRRTQVFIVLRFLLFLRDHPQQ